MQHLLSPHKVLLLKVVLVQLADLGRMVVLLRPALEQRQLQEEPVLVEVLV